MKHKSYTSIMQAKYQYLALSLISGILETGVIIAGFTQFNLAVGLAFALAYQIGCLVRNPINLSLRGAGILLCISLVLLPFVTGYTVLVLILVASISGGIQSAREWLAPKYPPIPVSVKRSVRVIGFILGILGGAMFGHTLLFVVSLLSCLVVLPAVIGPMQPTPWIQVNRRWKSDGYGWIMLVHQTHYFVYAYVLLAHLLQPGQQAKTFVTIWQAGFVAIWFTLGWLSYISGKKLLNDILKLPVKKAVIVGHVWVVICLVFMAVWVRNPYLLGIAWVLGGFGGGSVYAIKELAEKRNCSVDIELWEHYGHNAGVLLSLSAVILLPACLELPFMLAAAAATGTIILLLTIENGYRRSES